MCESAVGKRVAFGQVCDRQSSAVDQMQESGTGKPSTVQKHELVQNVRLENPLSNYLPAELQMWTRANTNRLMRIERCNTATDAAGGGGCRKYCLHVQKVIAFKHVGQKQDSLLNIHQKAASKAMWNMWLIGAFYVSYR